MDRIPNNIEIDIEIPMSYSITHSAHIAPWNLGVGCSKLSMIIHYPYSRLSNNYEVHDNRLLGTLVRDEFLFAHAFNK